MKILVTGANGFVGAPLCAELLKQGHAVRGSVRLSGMTQEGIEEIVVGNIDANTDWRAALHQVDVVIHLAARVHVMKDLSQDPLAEFLKVNVQGTKNLALQAVQAGVKRVVYVSSVKVNGEITSGAQAFSASDPPNPQDPYGVSKWQAEQELHRLGREIGLDVVIVRPPLVYGPEVKGNFIRLLSAINAGVPVPLAGAKNLRSLIYVGNLVSALIACAVHPSASGQTYLVSDGEAVSTAMLVAKMAVALGKKSRSFYVPPSVLRAIAGLIGRKGHMDRLFGSLQVNDLKIRNELNWASTYSLAQGLQVTAEWYLNQGNGYNRS